MNILEPQKIEEYIVSLLQRGPISNMGLVKEIAVLRPKTTKQAVYDALRKLKKAEMVVTHGKTASLKSAWISDMSDFFAKVKHFYFINSASDDGFLSFEDGDKITYNFKNPEVADGFWGHAFDILSGIMPTTEPIYIYNPHEWVLLAREDQEVGMFSRAKKQNKQILLTCSGTTPLDKYVKRFFDGTYLQYYLSPIHLFKKPNYYLNVLGDYLIEVWIDEKTHEKIETFYKNHETFDEEAKNEIQNIIATQGKNKISISRNSEKAEKLKKMLRKEFYVIPSK